MNGLAFRSCADVSKLETCDSDARPHFRCLADQQLTSAACPLLCVQSFYNDLDNAKPGTKGGLFTAYPPFWTKPLFVIWSAAASNSAEEEARMVAADKAYAEFKKDYDQSRSTVTRTSKCCDCCFEPLTANLT